MQQRPNWPGAMALARLLARKRVAVAAGLAVALLGGLALAQVKPGTADLETGPINVTATPIARFEKDGPSKALYGKLEWRGGLVLHSPAASFGGWSGLAFDPDGERLIAISDAGTWMTGKLIRENGRPKAIADAVIGPIKGKRGAALARRRDRDAESVALAAGSLDQGEVLIAFEQNDRIGRFPITEARLAPPSGYLAVPAPVRSPAMGNDGFEGVTVLRGGPYKGLPLAFAEHPVSGEAEHSGWIWVGGVPKQFHLAGVGDYDITDAASLSDGSLIVLERRFRWSDGVRMRLVRVAADEVKPGANARGELLIEAGPGEEIDNMEGLAVREMPDGELRITMISDDNFNALLQRTVLLEFALPAEKKPEPEAAEAEAKPKAADAK